MLEKSDIGILLVVFGISASLWLGASRAEQSGIDFSDSSTLRLGAGKPSKVNEFAQYRISLAGEPRVVYEENQLGCESKGGRPIRNDHPDTSARAYRDYRGVVHLLSSSSRNFELTGPSLENVARRSCHQVFKGGGNNDPSKYDQYHWLAAVYTEDGKKIAGLTHQEFHGDRIFPECRDSNKSAKQSCMMTSINLVTSNNGGESFSKVSGYGSPLISSPYKFDLEARRVGVREPTNIVKSKEDGHLYFLFNADRYRDQRPGLCVARASTMQFDDLRIWGGENFDRTPGKPYSKSIDDPERHLCAPVLRMFGRSLTYNSAVNAYLLLGHTTTEVQYSWSRDLIHWSEPVRLMDHVPYADVIDEGRKEMTAYYSFLDSSSGSRNFETTDAKFQMFYAQYTFGQGANPGRKPVRRALRKLMVVDVELQAPE